MQAIAMISPIGFTELAGFIFEQGEPLVFQAYSPVEKPALELRTASELIVDIQDEIHAGQTFLFYCIHYPDTRGYVLKQKIKNNPKKSGEHTWHMTVEGWGLIQLQADLKHAPEVECRVAVNSEKRAAAWAGSYPEFRSPELWDWKAVQKHTARIIRRLKKIARDPVDSNTA